MIHHITHCLLFIILKKVDCTDAEREQILVSEIILGYQVLTISIFLSILILVYFSNTKIQQIIETTKFISTFFSKFHIVYRRRQSSEYSSPCSDGKRKGTGKHLYIAVPLISSATNKLELHTFQEGHCHLSFSA